MYVSKKCPEKMVLDTNISDTCTTTTNCTTSNTITSYHGRPSSLNQLEPVVDDDDDHNHQEDGENGIQFDLCHPTGNDNKSKHHRSQQLDQLNNNLKYFITDNLSEDQSSSSSSSSSSEDEENPKLTLANNHNSNHLDLVNHHHHHHHHHNHHRKINKKKHKITSSLYHPYHYSLSSFNNPNKYSYSRLSNSHHEQGKQPNKKLLFSSMKKYSSPSSSYLTHYNYFYYPFVKQSLSYSPSENNTVGQLKSTTPETLVVKTLNKSSSLFSFTNLVPSIVDHPNNYHSNRTSNLDISGLEKWSNNNDNDKIRRTSISPLLSSPLSPPAEEEEEFECDPLGSSDSSLNENPGCCYQQKFSSSLSSSTTPLPSSSSPTTICLATIMEILPLILLLSMGIIISTTCAKYTYPSSVPMNDGGSGNDYHNLPLHLSSSDIMLNYHNRTNDDNNNHNNHQHQEQPPDLQNMMMGDEESPDTPGNTHYDTGRPRYAGFQSVPASGSAQSSHHYGYQPSSSTSKTSPATSSQSPQALLAQLAHQYSAMRLQWLSNSSVTCNDGTRAGYYIRPSPTNSRRWLIFLEGGWYCMSKSACDQRWYKMRDFMTSFRWSQYKAFSGILSSSSATNPYWWNANHVFIPYCSSDIWSGDSPAPPTEMAFLGSRIIDEVIKELINNPSYHFLDAKFVLLTGSSAGAAGVMINLDRVAKMISDAGSNADVRGLADSGWILDNEPDVEPNNKPSKISSSSIPCMGNSETLCNNGHPTDTIKGAYKLWKSRVPEACAKRYPNEPWRCYFGYRLYPTLNTPLFVVQFQYDEFQIYMDGMTSTTTTSNTSPISGGGARRRSLLNEMDKMRYIRHLSDQMTSTLANVSAVFAPSCMSHILLTRYDWHKVQIRGVTLPEALNCWEQTPAVQHRYYHHNQYHRMYPATNKFTNSWTSSPKQQRFNNGGSSSAFGYAHKSEYLLPSSSDDDHNELSQFYSSSSSGSGSDTNFLKYLSNLNNQQNNNSSNSYYSHLNQQQPMEMEEPSQPKVLWKSSESSINTQKHGTNTTNTTTFLTSMTNSTSGLRPSVNTNTNKKRKKRKRRKGHHHRKSSSSNKNKETGNGSNSEHNLHMLNDEFLHRQMPKSLHTYYQTIDTMKQPPLSNHHHHHHGNMHPYSSHYHHHNHPVRMCQFRLIDDQTYPNMNQECPRVFQQQQPNNNNPNDKTSFSSQQTGGSMMNMMIGGASFMDGRKR